jgi:simple sugar transport system permease protein
MLRLEKRSTPSPHWRWLAPVLAVGLTILTGLLIFAVLGKDPLLGFEVFFLDPLRSLYGVTELLLKATPLALIGMGLAVGFRAGIWNIGAEGQFLLGAVFATGAALFLPGITGLSLAVMVLAGMLGGMAWAAIPAFLRARFHTNEILVSLMLVYVAQLFVSWLVFGPWRDPRGFNFPQTEMFDSAWLLPTLLTGSRLNLAFVLTIVILIIGHVLLARSFYGFSIRVAGESPNAARYAGLSEKRNIYAGLLIGGACAGFAGMAEVAGPMGQLTDKASVGYGFAAIIVAFVGRLQPLGIGLAALVMALFFLGGEQAQQYLNLPGSISRVFQGLLLFYLLAADVLVHFRLVRQKAKPRTEAAA